MFAYWILHVEFLINVLVTQRKLNYSEGNQAEQKYTNSPLKWF